MTVMKDRLRADAKTHTEAARAIAAKAQSEGRDLTDDERAEVESLVASIKGITSRIEAINADETLTKALGDLGDGPISFDKYGQGGGEYVPAGKGSQWARQVAGKLIARADRHGVKALTSGTIEIPAPIAPIVDLPGRPTSLLDLIPRRRLTSNTFEFIRQTLRTNNAAPVADGATKPTSAYTVTDVEGRARVWAHLSEEIPNRFFADIPELVALIDRQMREDLMIALETNVISGNGTGENFTGILNTSGTVSQAFDADVFATTRKALTTLQATFQNPTAFVMNPTDWEAVDLLQDNDGRYYYGGPTTAGPRVLHGLPVVVTPAITAGTALLGDFNEARLWIREDMELSADSTGDLFKTNETILRVEGRYGFGVLRPAAFAEIEVVDTP